MGDPLQGSGDPWASTTPWLSFSPGVSSAALPSTPIGLPSQSSPGGSGQSGNTATFGMPPGFLDPGPTQAPTPAVDPVMAQLLRQQMLLTQGVMDLLNRTGFFSLRSGRSRSKARSLHETKLLVRKLLHGRRWSHEAWQITTRKTTNTQKTKNRARRRSPSQICVLPFERQQSKQPTGPEPNKKNHKRFAKDTVVKTHCVTIKTKTCSKRIMPPKNVRHANYVVASKATRSRVYYTRKPTQPLRVHSQVLVHVPKFKKDQVPDGINTSRRTMTCMARCLVPLPIAGSGPVATTARSHGAR